MVAGLTCKRGCEGFLQRIRAEKQYAYYGCKLHHGEFSICSSELGNIKDLSAAGAETVHHMSSRRAPMFVEGCRIHTRYTTVTSLNSTANNNVRKQQWFNYFSLLFQGFKYVATIRTSELCLQKQLCINIVICQCCLRFSN